MNPSSESDSFDAKLLKAVISGSMRKVKTALSAGASVNGDPSQPCPPIVAATSLGNLSFAKFLIDLQADPDTPVPRDLPSKVSGYLIMRGERALHVAATRDHVEAVRMLLQARADPNVTDAKGQTPLVMACVEDRVESARLLLEAGADPTLAQENGYSPLHVAALHGHLGLVDMLCSRSPDTLNRYATAGETPLFLACTQGHEGVISRLLSAGACQRMPPDERGMCPLAMAVKEGHAGAVRVIVEQGLEAVGGEAMLPNSMYGAIRYARPRTLRVLLEAYGEARQAELPRTFLLTHASAFGCRAAVDLLLRAGANEASPNQEGRLARDVIGTTMEGPGQRPMDRARVVAIRRMLGQGAAYRARSWLWRSSGGGRGDGGGDGLSPTRKGGPLGVRLGVRALVCQSEGTRLHFGNLIGRYAKKE